MSAIKPYIKTLFLVLILCNGAFAQVPPAINYNLSNGLPSNHIYSVTQDKLGYIWFLTDDGLVKYDGYDYRVFTTKDGLHSNDIWMVSEDALGDMWVIGSYAKQVGFIKNNKLNIVYRDSIPIICYNIFHNDTTTYFEYSTGANANTTKNLVSYNATTGELNKAGIPVRFDKQELMPLTKELSVVTLDQSGKISVFNDVFSGSNVAEDLCDSILNYYEIMHVSSVCYPIQHSTYLSYRARTDRFFVLKHLDCSFEDRSIKEFGCAEDEHIVVFYYKEKEYVLVTNRQLIALDSNLSYKRSLVSPETFERFGGVVFSMLDNERAEWYATFDNGAYRVPAANKFFKKNSRLTFLKGALLASNNTNGKTYWYNSETALLYGLKNNILMETIQLPKGGFKCHVSESPIKNCISISTPSGFYLYDTTKKSISRITDGKTVIYNKKQVPEITKPITTLADIHYWYKDDLVYCVRLGFDSMHVANDSLKVATSILKHEMIGKDMYYDSSRNLFWVYNTNGIACYNPETLRDLNFRQIDKWFSSIAINSIIGDKYGNIYIYNSDKLYLFYPELGVLKKITNGFSVLNGNVKVSGSTIVISGEFGLAYAEINGAADVDDFKLIPNVKKSVYNKVTDMSFNEGSVTINTDNGVYSIILKDEEFIEYAHSMHKGNLSKLMLEIPYEQIVDGHHDTIVVDQNNELLKFNLINYSGSGNVHYLYKVNAKNWNSNLSGEVFIGNLKPGVAHKVLCKANDDIWETPTQTLYVYRKPNWYQTSEWRTAFWVIGVAGFIGLIFVTVGTTRYVVARNNEKKQQMTDLQLRAIYSQINPHFIFNSLASALYFIDNKKFDDAYNHVSKFSKLLRGYLKSSQERFVVLSEEIAMLKNYVELQQTRFEERFDCEIYVDNKIPAQSILIPSLLLQPIVENAINHGLFHLVEKGKLEISFMQGANSDELICKIEDNGVGREKAEQIKKENTDRKESYGTQLTEKLMGIFKNYEQMNISMEYIDKLPPEHGTIVILTIKNLKYVV